jgi:integrase
MRLQQVVTEMLNDIGLKKEGDGRGPHTFRHYVASYLFYSGRVRLEDIAFLLGDTVDTIRQNYLHPTSLMLREIVSNAFNWSI